MNALHFRRLVIMTQPFLSSTRHKNINTDPRSTASWKSTLHNTSFHRDKNIVSTKSYLTPTGADLVFCRKCGKRMSWRTPPGDSKQRHICSSCGYIDYQNPKLIVGCITEHDNKILLCQRGIEPCKGRWTLPAGFLELGESTGEGAIRETMEEANANVSIISIFSMIDIPVIGQSYVIFRAKLLEPFTHKPGHETLETKLIHPSEIPYDQIAFSSISETLKAYERCKKEGRFGFHHGVISKKPGSMPNDPASFQFNGYTVC